MKKIALFTCAAIVAIFGAWSATALMSQSEMMASSISSIASMSLTNSTFTNSTANAVVGTVSVVMSPPAPAFSGTLSITGANTGGFQLVGTTLETNAAGTTSGTYSDVTIVATQAGVNGSPHQITPTLVGSGGGGTIACDVGPNYTGSIPAAAQAAGFTHCVANYDFTQTAAFTTNGHSYTWSNVAGWLDPCGAANPLAYNWGYGGQAQPCSDYNVITDNNGDAGQSNGQVLQLTYTPADNAGVNGQTFFSSTSTVGNPSPGGIAMKDGFYAEEVVRLTSATVNSSCQSWNVGCLTYDFWSYAVGGTCTNCDFGGMEFDFVEMYTNGNNFENGGTACCGNSGNMPIGTASAQASYHTFGALSTVVNSSTGTNIGYCYVLDNAGTSFRCLTGGVNLANDIQAPLFGMHLGEIGPQRNGNNCGPSANQSCAPTANQNALIQRATIFSCPGYGRSAPCYSSSVVLY